VFSYVAMPPSAFWYDRMTLTASARRSRAIGLPTRRASAPTPSATAALRPSLEQSLIGQPWSRVLNGHAPLLMWR
jgi:hypothetical protein